MNSKITELAQTIYNLCNNPHWESKRRWRILECANEILRLTKQVKQDQGSYCVIWRSGGRARWMWHSTSPKDFTGASRDADEITVMGFTSWVVKRDDLQRHGVPMGYECEWVGAELLKKLAEEGVG